MVNLFSFMRRLWHMVLRVFHSLYFPPALILALIIVGTVFGWLAATQSLRHDVITAGNIHINALQQSLSRELSSYEQILRGGVGLFQGSDNVTKQDFANYLNAYAVHKNYPNVQAIGFAKVLTSSAVADIQPLLEAEGIGNFELSPTDPPRDVYAPTLFMELVASNVTEPKLGFDMYSEPTRRTAMEQARDNATTVITNRLVFDSPDTSTPPVGFNMYTPYYGPNIPTSLAERQQNIQGYMYASFRTAVLFKNAIEHIDTAAIGFRITPRGQAGIEPLYESNTFASIVRMHNAARADKTFRAYGQIWDIQYALNPSGLVSEVQLRRPGGVIFFGVFSAILITTIIWLLLRGRTRALTAQRDRAVELAKDELLSLASHQLRTPATGVKQYLGMVLQGFAGPVSKEQKPLLEKAYASNDRQLQAINEILHMAKIDSGRIVLARQDTNLVELLRDIVHEQRADIESSEHAIKIEVPKRPIHLYVDTHMLRMAVENLLSNAIKYTPREGSITITMRKDAHNVRITIKDTGVGIAQADFPKLFKQFTRLPNEMSQRVSGTGVGLYLAKHLVALHHGSISVESEPGKGTSFTITLPLEPNQPEKAV